MKGTYWIGKTKNGEEVSERTHKWIDISDQLSELGLRVEEKNQTIRLPSNLEYVQAKTASASLSGGEATIESRYIGASIGKNLVIIRVNESSGDIQIEIK